MGIIKYKLINDEEELREKIENLDTLAKNYLTQIEDFYIEDIYLMSVIDKSIKLINSFLFALDEKNLTVLAILTRVQIDCATRAYAMSLVDDSSEFCKDVIINGKAVNKLIDKNNKKLTDKHLCNELGGYLGLPLYDLYSKVCGFVHFSSSSFHNIAKKIAKAESKCTIEMLIGRNNREEDKETYLRLSLELANQFLFFGEVLVQEIFGSWLIQKKTFRQ